MANPMRRGGPLHARDLSPTERAAMRCFVRPFLWAVGSAGLLLLLVFFWAAGQFSRADNLMVVFVLALLVMYGPLAVVHSVRRAVRRIDTLYGPGDNRLRDPGAVAELTDSRREIVAAFEIERRRIERDLHDGAQQYLVMASMDVGEADLLLDTAVVDGAAAPDTMREVRRLLAKAQNDADEALRALRHTVAGIHPKVLSDLGLEAAVRNLAAESPLEVTLRVPHPLPALPEGVIAAGYFLVAEALTNAAKYAPGSRVSVLIAADEDLLLSVVDDGPGGAVVHPDHGLAGMKERLAAFGGTFTVLSPPGGPTSVSGRIPLLLRRGEFGVVVVSDEGEETG